MKVIIAGGGTGGHLFPGIAVAEELVARGHQLHFVGTRRGIEARVCPAAGYPIHFIDVGGLKGAGLRGLWRGLLRLPRALWQSFAILRAVRPDLVVGVGGYASGPLLLAAWLRGCPTAILEQNSVPGLTNRLLGKLVRRVFGGFSSAARYFPVATYRPVGNPIRKALRDRLTAATNDAAGDGLLVVGGSQGAHAVNELVCEAMLLLAKEGRQIALIHQSGEADFAALQKKYNDAGLPVEVRPFIDDMAQAYRRAALAITRAGASTLAEVTALGIPTILIPFPSAADDHQTENARLLEAEGAARVLRQATTTPALLARAIAELFADEPERQRMAAAARRLGRLEAHREIADALETLVHPSDRHDKPT